MNNYYYFEQKFSVSSLLGILLIMTIGKSHHRSGNLYLLLINSLCITLASSRAFNIITVGNSIKQAYKAVADPLSYFFDPKFPPPPPRKYKDNVAGYVYGPDPLKGTQDPIAEKNIAEILSGKRPEGSWNDYVNAVLQQDLNTRSSIGGSSDPDTLKVLAEADKKVQDSEKKMDDEKLKSQMDAIDKKTGIFPGKLLPDLCDLDVNSTTLCVGRTWSLMADPVINGPRPSDLDWGYDLDVLAGPMKNETLLKRVGDTEKLQKLAESARTQIDKRAALQMNLDLIIEQRRQFWNETLSSLKEIWPKYSVMRAQMPFKLQKLKSLVRSGLVNNTLAASDLFRSSLAALKDLQESAFSETVSQSRSSDDQIEETKAALQDLIYGEIGALVKRRESGTEASKLGSSSLEELMQTFEELMSNVKAALEKEKEVVIEREKALGILIQQELPKFDKQMGVAVQKKKQVFPALHSNISKVTSARIKKYRDSRAASLGAFTKILTKNVTDTSRGAKLLPRAVLTKIAPIGRSSIVWTDKASSDLVDANSKAEATAFDTTRFLNKTRDTTEKMLSVFDDDIAEADRVSLGDTSSVSQSFLNRLASVGSESRAAAAQGAAEMADDAADQIESLVVQAADSRRNQEALNSYASGAAAQSDYEMRRVKELLADLNGNLGGTLEGLLKIMKNQGRSGKENVLAALNFVTETLGSSTNVTTPSDASAREQIDAQLAAVIAVGNVSQANLQALSDAAASGNSAAFNKLLTKIAGTSGEFADAVASAASASKQLSDLQNLKLNGMDTRTALIGSTAGRSKNELEGLRGRAAALTNSVRQLLGQKSADSIDSFRQVSGTAMAAIKSFVNSGKPATLEKLVASVKSQKIPGATEAVTAVNSAVVDVSTAGQRLTEPAGSREADALALNTQANAILRESETLLNQTWIDLLATANSRLIAQENTTTKSVEEIRLAEEKDQNLMNGLISTSSRFSTLTKVDPAVASLKNLKDSQIVGESQRKGAAAEAVALLARPENAAVAAEAKLNDSAKLLDNLWPQARTALMTSMTSSLKASDSAASALTHEITDQEVEASNELKSAGLLQLQALGRVENAVTNLGPLIGGAALKASPDGELSILKNALGNLGNAQETAAAGISAVYESDAVRAASFAAQAVAAKAGASVEALMRGGSIMSSSAHSKDEDFSQIDGAIGTAAAGSGAVSQKAADSVKAAAEAARKARAASKDQSGTSSQVVEISGDELTALIMAMASSSAQAGALADSQNSNVASMRADLKSIVSLMGEMILSALNVSSDGYVDQQSLERSVADELQGIMDGFGLTDKVAGWESSGSAAAGEAKQSQEVNQAVMEQVTEDAAAQAASASADLVTAGARKKAVMEKVQAAALEDADNVGITTGLLKEWKTALNRAFNFDLANLVNN